RSRTATVSLWLSARTWFYHCLSVARSPRGTRRHRGGDHAGRANFFEYRHDHRLSAHYWSAAAVDELRRLITSHNVSVPRAVNECAHSTLSVLYISALNLACQRLQGSL